MADLLTQEEKVGLFDATFAFKAHRFYAPVSMEHWAVAVGLANPPRFSPLVLNPLKHSWGHCSTGYEFGKIVVDELNLRQQHYFMIIENYTKSNLDSLNLSHVFATETVKHLDN